MLYAVELPKNTLKYANNYLKHPKIYDELSHVLEYVTAFATSVSIYY